MGAKTIFVSDEGFTVLSFCAFMHSDGYRWPIVATIGKGKVIMGFSFLMIKCWLRIRKSGLVDMQLVPC